MPTPRRPLSSRLSPGYPSKHSELALLQGIRARAGWSNASRDLRVGIGDDCAVLRCNPSEEIVLTTDLSLERVHFRRDWHTPESVGHRCLARGLSDLAAMGARPVAAFVSLAIPLELARGHNSWISRFYDGVLRLAEEYTLPLAGGDLAQAPELVSADIIVIGAVARGKALLRSGASAGDAIYVTGALGGAAAELLAMEWTGTAPSAAKIRKSPDLAKNLPGTRPVLESTHPHLWPQPRIAVGRELVRRRMATAAIDVSDGLSTDLRHLCEESGLAAEIDAAALPIHTMAELAACAGLTDSALALALHGGEDYEVLFTSNASAKVPTQIASVPIYRIGRMKRKLRREPIISIKLDGRSVALEAQGWEHFHGERESSPQGKSD